MLQPSIDAIDPVVVGEDGTTRYHEKINITITSDSVNRMVTSNPRVFLNAVLQMVESPRSGQRAYENGIGIARNCLINYYEYGVLGKRQHSFRIGLTPPKNMSAISNSYRTADRLPRTVSNNHVWRCCTAPSIGWLDDRCAFRPRYHD